MFCLLFCIQPSSSQLVNHLLFIVVIYDYLVQEGKREKREKQCVWRDSAGVKVFCLKCSCDHMYPPIIKEKKRMKGRKKEKI